MKYFHWFALGGIGAFSAASVLFYTMPGVWPDGLMGDREIGVHILTAHQRTEPLRVRVSGKILPRQEVDIASRLAGKIVEMRFKVGNPVRAGEIVATVQSNTLTRRIAETESALNAARNELATRAEQLARAEKELVRRRELLEKDLIARRDVEQAASDAETAQAQVELARARVAQQEAMLAQARTLERLLRVTTPVSGVIQRRWVEPGAVVAESSTLLTVGDGDSLKAMLAVPAKHSDDIHAGLTAEIVDPSAPNKFLPGKVVDVDRRTRDGERDVKVEFRSDSGERFHAGSRIEASILTDAQEDGIWVPQSIVVADKGRNYVYKIAGGRALRQEVVLGVSRNGEVRVAGGLENGDWLAADNLKSLKAGKRVRAITATESRGAQ